MSAPRYRLIRGDFYVLYPDLPRNGPEPDGDTISFLPENDDLVQALPRFSTPPGRPQAPGRLQRAVRGHRRAGDPLPEPSPEPRVRQRRTRGDAARDRLHPGRLLRHAARTR